MAITTSQIGSEISTEKLVVRAVSDDVNILSMTADIFINTPDLTQNSIEIEHLPAFGTNDTFDFEINSIVKDYFASEFLPLTGVNQTTVENALVTIVFQEQLTTGIGANAFYNVIVKNMTQDTFEIEEFDLADYDCGDAGNINSKLLTSAPNPLLVGDNTSFHVSCLTTSYDGTTPKQEWVIETYLNGSIVLATTEAVDVPTRGISGGGVPDGKYDISNYRFDFKSIEGYDEVRIYIRDIASPFIKRSETRVYKLRQDCERTITLSWLNEFGVQDSFTFAGNINRVGKYKDETFKRVRPVNPVSTDVGDLVYSSNYNYQYDIFSDRMPENTVQWVSKILVNKRAAIQNEAVLEDNLSVLYNFYTVNNGVAGDGRATGGIVNNSLPNWVVASQQDFEDLRTFLGGLSVTGGKMKEVGFDYWDSPNTGATNESGFNAKGKGDRNIAGGFQNDKILWSCWTSDEVLGNNAVVIINTLADLGYVTQADYKTGYSIRLVRPAVGGENDGDVISGAYVGNDGRRYNGIVIGSQVWINEDLRETKYNDGSTIANVEDNTAWSNLTTGAYAFYDNLEKVTVSDGKYFPIVIETAETTLEDKFTPETLFRLKFRLANRRKGLK